MFAGPKVRETLELARGAGLELWVEGRRLRYRAPPGTIPAVLLARLREDRDDIVAILRADAAREQRSGPLAENQRGLWLLSRMAPGSHAYHVALSLRLDGPLSVPQLEDSLQTLVDRHAVLRTTYVESDGVPHRVVTGHLALPLERIVVSGQSETAVEEIVRASYERPFDLAQGPAIRVTLLEQSSTASILLVVAHHLAVDGTSVAVLLDELVDIYTRLEHGSPIPPKSDVATFDEFVTWQQRTMEQSAEALDYWADVLTPPPPPLDLPADHAPTSRLIRRGATLSHRLDGKLSSRLREYARGSGATDFVVLLAMWFIFVRRISGQADVTVGTPVAGRSSSRFSRAVGNFMNVLPMRVRDLDGMRFAELVQVVREIALKALTNQDVALPTMLEHRARRGVAAAGQPFQTQFVLQEFARNSHLGRLLAGDATAAVAAGSLILRAYPLEQQEGQSLLSLDVFTDPEGFKCAWRYDRDQFDHETIEHWMRCFATLIDAALTAPASEIDLLAVLGAEDLTQLSSWNATAQAYPAEATLPAVIAAQAARTPEA